MSSPSKELLLVYAIEPLFVQKAFSRLNWPLHITLVPWFRIPNIDTLRTTLAQFAHQRAPFFVVAKGEALFGHNHTIKVTLVEPNKAVQTLHDDLLAVVAQQCGAVSNTQFIGQYFRPHATHQTHSVLQEGSQVQIDHFWLVELSSKSLCTPLVRYGFGQ